MQPLGRDFGAAEADTQHGHLVEPAPAAGLTIAQAIEVAVEEPAVERRGHHAHVDAPGDRAVGFGLVEQRAVGAERIEMAEARADCRDTRDEASGVACGLIRKETQRIGVEPPDEQPDVRDGVASRGRVDGTGGGAVARVAEGACRQACGLGIADRRGAERAGADMVDVLAPDQPLEKFDRDDGPAGDVARDLLDRGGGALGLAIAKRIRDIGAQSDLARAEAAHRARADQRADIGDDPRLAAFDEEIVVELVEVALDDREPLAEHAHQRLERPALLGVAVAQMLRQQLDQRDGRAVMHGRPPRSARCRRRRW